MVSIVAAPSATKMRPLMYGSASVPVIVMPPLVSPVAERTAGDNARNSSKSALSKRIFRFIDSFDCVARPAFVNAATGTLPYMLN